jgi:hypothetical protein
MMCFPGVGLSYQPLPTELTTNINLRETPDKNGKIIMLLKKGDRVIIHNETQKWANIVYDKNGRQINGWVSTLYLQKAARPSEEQKAADLEDKSTDQTLRSFSDTGSPEPPSPPERIAEAAEKQRTIVSEALPPSNKTAADRAPKLLSGDDASSFFKNKENILVMAEDSNLESGQVSTYGFVAVITRVLFKMTLVIISCVALFFSYSAMQIAKSNRQMPYVSGGKKIII